MKKLPNKSFIICIFCTLTITASMITNQKILILLSFLVISIAILFDKLEYKINYLIYFVSWVYVFKININSQSLYSFLIIIFIVSSIYQILIKNMKIPVKITITFFILSISIIISTSISSAFRILDIVNFIFNYSIIFMFSIIMVNNQNKNYKNYKNYIIFYILGVLSSAIVGYIAQYITQMSNFLNNTRNSYTEIVKGQVITRFSGLDLDPNYFALQVLMAICLTLILIYKNKFNKYYLFLFLFLSIFGFLSSSKMFLISYIILTLYFLINFCKINKKINIKSILLIIVLVMFIFFIIKELNIVDIYKQRIANANGDPNKLTTGRSQLWNIYFNNITNDIKTFFIGNGISSYLNGEGAHNIYLIMWYKIGMIGIVFYCEFILVFNKMLGKNNKRKDLMAYSPLYLTLFVNFALDSFTYNFFPIHLLMIIISIKYIQEVNL